MSNKTDFIRVKGVNTKPKYAKFNSGALLLDNDTWLNVSKDVDINSFQKDNTYAVDIETNDKGYKTVVKNNTTADDTPMKLTPKAEKKTNWEARDKSMILGGIFHDAATLVAASAVGTTVENQLKQFEIAVEGLLKIRKELE
jgi:hypothetical protein